MELFCTMTCPCSRAINEVYRACLYNLTNDLVDKNIDEIIIIHFCCGGKIDCSRDVVCTNTSSRKVSPHVFFLCMYSMQIQIGIFSCFSLLD